MTPDSNAISSLEAYHITPWTVVGILLIPLVSLIIWGKIYPTRRTAWLLAIPCVLTIPLPMLWSWWWMVIVAVDAALVALVTVDLFTLPKLKNLTATRTMARVASLGGWQNVQIRLEYRGKPRLDIRLADDASDGLEIDPPFHSVRLQGNKLATLNHRIRSERRGRFELSQLFLELKSRLGFWIKKSELPCPGELHVYPDIQQIAEYALLARTNRLNLIGVRRTRRAGQENNFERLRDYQEDDNYKHIDWRSTARRQKLTVRQYQADQSQRVIFLLDCGRMMTNEYEGKSLLDYSLNSMLMLSYVALSQGDSVGLLCFSDRIHNFVPPTGGKRQLNRLLHAGFNQFPNLVQSRFDQAFLYLSTHCRRRSLVVLLTNVIDQVNADQIQNYLGNLIGCHLPLLVLLRDHSVFRFADNPAPDPAVLYRSAAASQLLLWRHHVIRRLQAQGCFALDVFPEEMTSPLVNKYLQIKSQHLL